MGLKKPLVDVICQACTLKFSANENEVAPDVVRCPRCGHEREIEWPPSYEDELGCGPLAGAAAVLFGLTTIFGGGGILGGLLGIVLGLGIPAALAAAAYHSIRGVNEDE